MTNEEIKKELDLLEEKREELEKKLRANQYEEIKEKILARWFGDNIFTTSDLLDHLAQNEQYGECCYFFEGDKFRFSLSLWRLL